jgi:hypothetical protein
MNESFKIWLKAIPEGWKFFGAVVGFGSIIWFTAIKIDHWKDKGINQDNIIEHLKQALMTTALLPPANEITAGTKVFNTTLKMEVISDGTNWCKPDGTTL